jgi:hypothetical protein
MYVVISYLSLHKLDIKKQTTNIIGNQIVRTIKNNRLLVEFILSNLNKCKIINTYILQVSFNRN